MCQEIPVPIAIIWRQWRASKMSEEDCMKDPGRCRDRAAVSAIQHIEFLMKRKRMIELEAEIVRVQVSW